MPKHEIIHPAGQRLSPDIKENLLKFFNNSDLHKLELLGGRISISVTAPYVDKKRRDKTRELIDINFVDKINNTKNDLNKLEDILNNLTIKELKKLCILIGYPVKSNAKSSEIKSELMKNFFAEDFWNRISGTDLK